MNNTRLVTAIRIEREMSRINLRADTASTWNKANFCVLHFLNLRLHYLEVILVLVGDIKRGPPIYIYGIFGKEDHLHIYIYTAFMPKVKLS